MICVDTGTAVVPYVFTLKQAVLAAAGVVLLLVMVVWLIIGIKTVINLIRGKALY